MIHPSHTRKDLLDIIEIYHLYENKSLNNYKELNKKVMTTHLWKAVCKTKPMPLPKDDKYYFFENITDIKLYLTKPSPNKKISDKLLLDINEKVKNIIYYCKKCSYLIDLSNYESIEQLHEDAEFIRQFGNQPNVRRAIILLNKDNKTKNEFKLIMSSKVKNSLNAKNKIKQDTALCFKKKHGLFIVEFL